jgi:hypothetical protein
MGPTRAMDRLRNRAWRFSVVVVLGGTILGACSNSSTGPTPGLAAKLKMVTQPPASVATRAVLNPAPVVQIVDGNGDPADTAGIVVTATLSSGGGTLAGTTTATSNASGVATFDNLQIQGLVGSRILRFTAGTLTAVSSTSFQLTAGPAAILVANSATIQNGVISQAVTTRPSVKVADLDGNGVAGTSVTFAITAGGGSFTGGTPTSNASGVATVGSWTLGSSVGMNSMTATSGTLTGSPVLFTANAGNVVSQFNIELQYVNPPTLAQQTAFNSAAARWSEVITGDVGAVNVTPPADMSVCGAPAGTTVSGIVNDLRIVVQLDSIDGPGNILGAASPCHVRAGGRQLPVTGIMVFDTFDLAGLQVAGDLDDVILHEMGHVLGFGTYWEPTAPNNFIVTSGAVGSTLGFNGPNAVAAYTGSNGGSGTAVPVEDGFGPGTARAHWKESIFQSEIMTGIITGTVRPLSLTTVRSLADIGYVVNGAAADAFNIGTQPTLRAGQTAGPSFELKNDILRVPRRYIDERTGQVVPGRTQ